MTWVNVTWEAGIPSGSDFVFQYWIPYDDFAETLSGEVEVMTCEVNIRPPNESSMRYHELHGFTRVATQETEGGRKEVALLEKKL